VAEAIKVLFRLLEASLPCQKIHDLSLGPVKSKEYPQKISIENSECIMSLHMTYTSNSPYSSFSLGSSQIFPKILTPPEIPKAIMVT
jgi:hypothetical protein